MNGLHQDIIALNRKIDRLSVTVEQLRQQIAVLIARDREGYRATTPLNLAPKPKPKTPQTEHWQSVMGHKDVLMDESDWEQMFEIKPEPPVISSELQVRRLTAQVTAAYNRIAALEEQLLAHRSHNSV
ncbi:MAG: hypothetical protein ACLFT0_07260 [Spirulinaceae cyanobacterium]